MDETARIAFITEGTSRHCRALCLELAERGWQVAFTFGDSAEDAEKLRAEMESLGATAMSYAVRDFSASELSAAVIETAEKFGGADLLIYFNEGPPDRETDDRLLLDIDEDDWDEAMNRGVKGFFLSCKYILPYLISRPGSRILAIDPVSPECGDCSLTEYVASRALQAAVNHISTEMSHYGVSAAYRNVSAEPDWLRALLEEI